MTISKTEAAGWFLDDQLWPVVVNRSAVKQLTDAQLKAGFLAMDQLLNRRSGKFSLVHDYTGAERLTPSQRQLVAEYGKLNRLRTAQRCLGIAFVFDSVLLRGILTAVHWVHHSGTPTKVFAHVQQAKVWAASLHSGLGARAFEDQGESVPPSIDNAS